MLVLAWFLVVVVVLLPEFTAVDLSLVLLLAVVPETFLESVRVEDALLLPLTLESAVLE